MSPIPHDQATGEGPLAGLSVVDLSTTMAGAFATQFLAEAGADVVLVEPPGGSPLRAEAAWPAVAGGKRSVVLDLHDPADRARLDGLTAGADALVTTMRPRAAERLGLTASRLGALNPRLVSVAITGWGSTGPWADLKGYEGMVMAKLGLFHAKQGMVTRPGPAFVSVPFASWGAAHSAVQGLLGALLERESSGLGQHVETDLVRGVLMLDTWAWFQRLVGLRWPDAYTTVDAATSDGEPGGALIYPLLVGPTKDGHWLQFAQVQPRLFGAMLHEFDMIEMLADPKWKGFPFLETPRLRTELWEYMLAKVASRTLAEWRHVFDTNPDINAEIFRAGVGALDHPQIRHDGRDAVVEDPERGPVRRPSTLVHLDGGPLAAPRPAPRLDEHGPGLRATHAAGTPTPAAIAPAESGAATSGAATSGAADSGAADSGAAEPGAVEARGDEDAGSSGLPLAGLTVLEFGVMFAAPFGATMLTDLGARVIKVESLEGDEIRRILPFPEAGGARVLQGKESVALDLGTDEGRRLVRRLVRHADIVLQGFRAGAAERAGIDATTLREINPDLVYVNAPGYGTDGPFGHRPAYAPSIGAAIGLALAEAPDAAGATGTMRDVKLAANRLFAASAVLNLQADGIAALGVASTMLLGALARRRGRPLPPVTVTMLGTGTHALLDRVVDYAGRPASPTVDPDGNGFHALYRMYPTARGLLFLAAPSDRQWRELAAALADAASADTASADTASAAGTGLADAVAALGDDGYATAAGRAARDTELAALLATILATRAAADWERLLTAADVGAVEVAEVAPEQLLLTDDTLGAEYGAQADSPVFEEHLRIGPPVRFSRSATQARGGCLTGAHTDAVLRELLGLGDAELARLREAKVIG
ncbi:CoA transferase [Frankia sp. AvcI1]|uniref:CoA transferase n=2 Tax=Frankia sp. AvcI1 TaxID=573496 RepID=UPI0006EC1797|nr:CoA transferase [Frankia sp. AvcI1]